MKKLMIVTALVAAGIGGFSYANHVASEKVKTEVDKQLALLTQETGAIFEYGSLSANMFSNSMSIVDMVVTSPEGQPFAMIDSIKVKGYETDKISEHTSFDIENFTFTQETQSALLRDVNPKLLSASYDLHSAVYFDDSSGESDIVLKLNTSEIADMGIDIELANTKELMDLSLEINKLQNSETPLTVEQELQQQTKLMQALSKIQPRSAKFALINQGDLKEIINTELESQGMTLEQMQQMAQQQLQQLPIPEDLVQQLNDFIMGLNELTVSASLPEGKTTMELSQELTMLLGQPEELVKFINLKVSGS
ncbi:hypothetical protein J8L70_01885 [Pseudoalteromonas sp. MMG010]|uniref:hypothetical protein n=1 Tax=Pseudoalteromonas sp. MMG010 TaxID=2822685 RepID=UPI001B3A0F1D|nr:hypothetical protein [Pseudoalteromonas sp. MMG010]MBQ4831982.1 hypothetical protein [Pseudoalteromonas sp. MMG010]